MDKVTKKIETGLCELSSLLQATLEEFVIVAEKIKDNKIKMVLRGLAVETRQYEHELNCQLQSLRIKEIVHAERDKFEELLQSSHSISKFLSDREISEVCDQSEASFDKAYSKVLNEYLPYSDLKSMLTYQWNSIKYSFIKMKLLNSI